MTPGDYQGVMITDRARSQDAVELSGVKQQKCLAHVQHSLSAVRQLKVGRGRSFTKKLMELLTASNDLWCSHRDGRCENFIEEARRLRDLITRHLRNRDMKDPDNARLLNELGRHDDRGNRPRFLLDPGIEPTNNRAERGLRPAAIGRKVSHCSKTKGGTEAYATILSVIRTVDRLHPGIPVTEPLLELLEGAPILPASD